MLKDSLRMRILDKSNRMYCAVGSMK